MAAVTAAVVGRSVFGLKALIDIPDQVPPGNVDFLYFIAIASPPPWSASPPCARSPASIDPAAMEAAPRHPAFTGGLLLGGLAFAFPRCWAAAMVRIETTIIGLTRRWFCSACWRQRSWLPRLGRQRLARRLFSSSLFIGPCSAR